VLDINGGTEDPLTEIIVEKIVKLAKAGGRDPTRMCIKVLAALESLSSPASSIRGEPCGWGGL
jgi:hypothetical protein